MNYSMAEKIRILLNRNNITIVELAKRLKISQSNMQNKLKRDNFTSNDLNEIAKVLNCEFEGYFVDKDGNKI